MNEKSHQWTTVCTSSHTTATAFFLKKSFENIPRNLSFPTKDSGLPYRRSISADPSIIVLSISALSPRKANFKPSELRWFTWSLMIGFNEQTTITKGEIEHGSKNVFTQCKIRKVILFPNPVGSAAKTSLPRALFSITSICSGFNSFMSGKIFTLEQIASQSLLDEIQFSAMLHEATKISLNMESFYFGAQRKSCRTRTQSWRFDA